jgi:hypothetical protein
MNAKRLNVTGTNCDGSPTTTLSTKYSVRENAKKIIEKIIVTIVLKSLFFLILYQTKTKKLPIEIDVTAKVPLTNQITKSLS